MQIETERLRLRDFSSDDWRRVLEYQRDPRYLRFYPWAHRTASDVQQFVQHFIDWQAEQPRMRFQLAIVLQQNNRLIGSCGVRMPVAGSHEAEIGYEIDPDSWGHGYATEAARAIVGFGFESLQLHRIHAHCIAENSASARVLEKLGMRQEGRLREKEWMHGRWWDVLIYSILAYEYYR